MERLSAGSPAGGGDGCAGSAAAGAASMRPNSRRAAAASSPARCRTCGSGTTISNEASTSMTSMAICGPGSSPPAVRGRSRSAAPHAARELDAIMPASPNPCSRASRPSRWSRSAITWAVLAARSPAAPSAMSSAIPCACSMIDERRSEESATRSCPGLLAPPFNRRGRSTPPPASPAKSMSASRGSKRHRNGNRAHAAATAATVGTTPRT